MINFKDLYEFYVDDVYRFAVWLSGNVSEAEDITSETFIRAWTHNSKIRTETLKAYLFTISRNIFLESLRKEKRQVALEDIYSDPAPGPDKRIESQSKLETVREVLETLPEIDRSAIVLRIQHELPYEEIARILRISLTASKVKVYRIRKKLIKACFEKEVD